jgi:hypothetical protein
MTISTAVERSGFVYAYDAKGFQLCVIPAGEGLAGYTGSSVSVKRNGFVYTYNEKGWQISVVPAH